MRQASRAFASLSTTTIAELDRSAVIIQPIGAVEQHGPHLPLITDAFVAECISHRAAARTGVEAYVLPTLSYGKSTEHLGWPGTISLSTETLLAVCRDVGRSVAASGFERLVFVNGHGGQPSLLDVVARDIRAETGLHVFSIMPGRLGIPDGVEAHDAGFGYHGGHIETSVMLALAPESVAMPRAVEGGRRVGEVFSALEHLTLEGEVPTAWLSVDVTANGVLGDPTSANAREGELLVEAWVDRLAAALEEIRAFRFPIR